MDKVVDFQKIKAEKKQAIDTEYVMTMASIEILEKCLWMLNLNSLKQLEGLKMEMRNNIKHLKENLANVKQ